MTNLEKEFRELLAKTTQGEICKDIKDYEGKYIVSESGKVFSLSFNQTLIKLLKMKIN